MEGEDDEGGAEDGRGDQQGEGGADGAEAGPAEG